MIPQLLVSAGGKGYRIQKHVAFEGVPSKHMLKVPATNDTLIGKIIRDATPFFKEIKIFTNTDNHFALQESLEQYLACTCVIDTQMTGPLGPFVRQLLSCEKSHVFGCVGDFYANFEWSDFLIHHNNTRADVTILVSKSDPTMNGATFMIDHTSSRIRSWTRKPQTSSEDLINIGAYIINASPKVKAILSKLVYHKEDPFFDLVLASLNVCSFLPQGKAFNINTIDNYQSLMEYCNV